MQVAGMILGCLLLGQVPDIAIPLQAVGKQPSPATLQSDVKAESGRLAAPPSIPGNSSSRRSLPPEMVAVAMMLPSGSTLAGQPLTLLSALGSTPDRRQQLEITRAYWSLAQAVAEYHFCHDHAQQLGRTQTMGNEPAALRLARTSAAAMLRQAELEATRAQCELARLVRLPADAPLPLPADRPHVGSYRTNFRELFAGRTPPDPAALMERILPIGRQAVDDQAAAVQAAEDALAAAADEGQNGRGDATAVTESSRELLRQQRAFIRSVCEYNRNIADYGLSVAGPTANPQALVAILIGVAPQGVAPVISSDDRGVQPTAASEPLNNPMRQPSRNEPTLAPPRGGWRTPEPTLAPPRDEPKKNEPTLAPSRDGLRPLGRNEPTLAPPRDEQGKEPASVEPKSLVPIEPLPSSAPRSRTANKPAIADRTAPLPSEDGPGEKITTSATSPLYPALVDTSPIMRAKQLTVALHWDRSLPEGIGKPISLVDCLMRAAGGNRQATIDAYWRLRQRAAEYQVLVQQTELLEGLGLVVLDRRNERSGATEMLQLRSAQLATQATLREAHVALIEAQYALALRLGATGDAAWPLASTVPHSGRYLLKLEAQPQSLVQSWPIRRLAATVPGLSESVQQHAAAVVEADTARVAAAEKYRAGGILAAQAIASITTQTEQTLALLDSLTEYNRAIAEYVLAVLPPAPPADRLVAALVVKP
jgi:hypothetical protein